MLYLISIYPRDMHSHVFQSVSHAIPLIRLSDLPFYSILNDNYGLYAGIGYINLGIFITVIVIP